jgi:hypothetical protein
MNQIEMAQDFGNHSMESLGFVKTKYGWYLKIETNNVASFQA